MRVAAIDQGTNTTRLLVADVDDGRIEEVDATSSSPARRGRRPAAPSASAPDRARAELPLGLPAPDRGARRGTDARRGTSAMRDAENGEAFLGEVEWSYGFTTRLLTGDEEALLTFRGVGAVDEEPSSSTSAAARPSSSRRGFHVSTDLGCVRLTERFLASDPPTRDELDGLARAHPRPSSARPVGRTRDRRRRHRDVAGRARPRSRRVRLRARPGPPHRRARSGPLDRLAALPTPSSARCRHSSPSAPR